MWFKIKKSLNLLAYMDQIHTSEVGQNLQYHLIGLREKLRG